MLAAALRAEADAFVAQHAEEVLPDGRQRVVRHGYGPSHSLDALLPVLDLRGISTSYFQEALSAILGADAPNLSRSRRSEKTANPECRICAGVATAGFLPW